MGPTHLLGRDRELRTARAGLDGPGVLVCGPDGCGRSAFVRALVAQPTLVVRAAPPSRGLSLFAVRVAVGPERCPTDPADAVEAVSAWLSAQGRTRPVVVVDDVAHLDADSQALLAALAGRDRTRLVAVRSAGTTWNEIGLTRVDLTLLDDDTVRAIVARRLGGPVEHRTGAAFVRMASGSPWLVRELLDAGLRTGVLLQRDGLWRLVGDVPLSPPVTEHAESLLAGLGADGITAVEALAVAGPIPDRIALLAVGSDGMEQAERSGLVDLDGEVVRLRSAVLAEHLRRRLGPASRRRLSSLLADAAADAGLGAEPTWSVAAAEWTLDAGRAVDADVLFDAARHAVDLGDTARAERLAAASVAARPTTEAVLLQSWCADEQGAVDRSESILAAHEPVGSDATVALAVRRAEQRFWVRRDQAGGRAIVEEAMASVESPWDLAAAMQLAVFDVLDGEVRRAVAAAEGHLEHPVQMVSSNAALAVALSLTLDDRCGEARAVAESALDRLSGPTPPLYIDPGVHIITLGFALLGADELDRADELTAAVHAHAVQRPGRQAQGWAALLRARVLLARGRPRAAFSVALEAEAVWVDAGLRGPARWSATVAAQAAAEAGDVAALGSCLERIVAEDPRPFRLFEPEVERVRSWAALLDGADLMDDAVVGRLAEVARAGAQSGRRHLGVLAAFDLVRMGAFDVGVSLLDELVAGGASTPLERRRRIAIAAAQDDVDALARAAAEWEGLGATGLAAECTALAAVASPARAVPARVKVASLIGSDGLDTPPLRSLGRVETDRALTAREREVVAMAAEGLSNRAIAERLVVSPRTIENHLHRAFAKLGVQSRSDLRS